MSDSFTHGYALLVGVDQNDTPELALPEVAKDVQALRDVLIHPQRCAYLPEHVRTLTGPQATRKGILDGLDWLHECIQADPEATVVIYYSGHGAVQESEYYFIPCDFRAGQFGLRALPAADVAAAVAALQPQRLLVVLDCCHAGGMGIKDAAALPEGISSAAAPVALWMKGEPEALGPEAKGMERLAQGRGRAVLSSSRGTQSSCIRRDRKMSIFTYHLIEALTGHAQPQGGASEVLVSDVMSHVWRRVPASAWADWEREQTPDYQVSGNFAVALLLGGEGLKGQPAPDPLQPLPQTAVVGERDVVVGESVKSSVIITGDKNVVYYQPPSIPPLPRPLPPTPPSPPPYFVGRKDKLDALKRILTSTETPQATVALIGMGGVGKTALARVAANQLRSDFPGGILWADLAQYQGNPFPILARWAQLGSHAISGTLPDPWAYADDVRDILAHWSAKSGRILIVLDDVRRDWLNGALVILNARPAGVPLLLTTRDMDVALAIGATECFSLDPLPLKQAVKLLEKRGGRAVRKSKAASSRLAELVGRLPLALELAGRLASRYASKPGWRLDDLCQRMEKEPVDRVLQITGHPGLAKTFSLSDEALDEDSKSLFRALGLLSLPSFTVEHVSAVLGWGGKAVEKTLEKLVFASLVRWEKGKNMSKTYYTLHPLLHEFAAQLTPDNEQASLRNEMAHNVIKSLTCPGRSQEQITAAGESLVALGWNALPPDTRTAALDVLRKLMCNKEVPENGRCAAALVLARLAWLTYVDVKSVSYDEMLAYLRCLAPYVGIPGELHTLESLVDNMLQRPAALSERERAQLLIYRAGMRGKQSSVSTGEEKSRLLGLAEEDYQSAEGIVRNLIAPDGQLEDYRMLARILLGRANIALERSRDALAQGDQVGAQNLGQEAVRLLGDAAEQADKPGLQDIPPAARRDKGTRPAEQADKPGPQDILISIYGQLCYAHTVWCQWEEAEQSYSKALKVLDDLRASRAILDPLYYSDYAWIVGTASHMHLQHAQSLTGKAALDEYAKAYDLAQKEIKVLGGSPVAGDEVELVAVHITAGDCQWAMSEQDPGKATELRRKACEHWKKAEEIAKRINYPLDSLIEQSPFKEALRECLGKAGGVP